MDREAAKCTYSEKMLVDANIEPTDLPLSLLESITSNFSEDKKIGSGGFSVVYEGLLQNGSVVAVKRLSQAIDLDEKNFNQEVSSLIRVKNKNIVRFLGYCADTQGKVEKYDGKMVMADMRQRLLCFEFLPNGGLDKHINDSSQGLEWRTRYQIIKGICKGLHYLHQQHIVHLDLKPANILLDYNMVPKIADFGLSKCFDEKQTRAITSKVVGSHGYMAPEFFSGEITFKSDIYSLGIIIAEILTGKKGYFQIDNVLESWSARFQMLQGGIWLEHVRVCAEIGLKCMDSNPVKRPMIKHILEMLDGLECTYGFMESDVSAMHVHPLLVSFPWDWEVNRCIKCPVTLTNKTEHDVGVWISPTSPDACFGGLGFPFLWELQSPEAAKGLTLFRWLTPHSSMVVFMTMRGATTRPLRKHMEMFDVVMFATKWWNLEDLELHLNKDTKSDDSWKRIKELGTEVYRATLRVVTCDPARCQEAMMTHQLIPASEEFGNIMSMDVHLIETWVLVGYSGGYVSIWNHETQGRVMDFLIIECCRPWPFASRICSTKFITGEHWFAVGDVTGYIQVHTYTTKDKIKEFEAHCGKSVDMLAIHPTDTLLLTASHFDEFIKLWDWGQGWMCVRVFDVHNACHLTVGPRDTNTFASSLHGSVKVWEFGSLGPIATLDGYTRPNFHSDNDQHFLTALLQSNYFEVKTWNLQTMKEVHRLITSSMSIDKIACHPMLPILASIIGQSTFLWDTRTYSNIWRSKLLQRGTGSATSGSLQRYPQNEDSVLALL
ncbi:hypothetical protein BS78_05G057900 [Paspalum vaginatum]|nr:hypothetical protein BS78_05G057900 [Paspalum vaginatum]KAJ1274386.1 hypothetical protein BS78_05G057900 [Paspalum vaginatum]KAJ1274387.1 hypothetical protein BS78_05G057900 [Paspalum vaginatum]KAJ1274388.1 hypothetical protein BS78_05G057900 [Paspalum vaginatum]KAJ1274389.1 hypothetical protein BS78_05G057900 [Paspalum vaginatum]